MVSRIAFSLALAQACLAQAPVAAGGCSPLELVIARGTTEPLNPTYGIVVGDPMFEATKALIPGITGYKVNYPASFDLDSKPKGGADAASHITSQAKACPQQKYALIGYSQGADVMHLAASKLDPSLYPRIVALVMFGDPGNRGPGAKSPMGGFVDTFPAQLAEKLKQNCEKGDPVCTNSGTVIGDHLVYIDAKKGYITESAQYILKQFQSGGKSGASPSPNGGPNDKGDNTQAMMELGVTLGGSKEQIDALGKAAGKVSRKLF